MIPSALDDADSDSTKKPDAWALCREKPICALVTTINNSVIFVDYNKKLHCPFSMTFGNGFVCNCKERLNFFLANNC